MAPLNIIIVGGGLSGALLANGLLSNDIPFTVYERDTVDSKREGYQIRLGESALVGFKACLPKDRMELITKKFGQSSGSTATAPAIFNTRWEEVVDMAVMPTYAKSAAINRVVLRDLLMEPIKKAGRVKYETAFDRYSIFQDDSGHEKVRVHFKDGTSDVCDILLGADGSGSRINAQLGAGNLVPLDTHFSFVSKGELPQERLKQLPERLLQGPVLLFKGTVSLYYALYLPGKDNPDVNDPSQGDSGVEYDQAAASFYWGIHIPRTEIPYAKPSDIPNTHQFVLDKLQEWGWAKEVQDLVRIGSDDANANVEAIQFRASKPLKKDWREKVRRGAVGHAHNDGIGSSRVWLLGDAVHAMQPNRYVSPLHPLCLCISVVSGLTPSRTVASMIC